MASWATCVEYHDSSSVAWISVSVKMLSNTIASWSEEKTLNSLTKKRLAGGAWSGASTVRGASSAGSGETTGGATVLTPATALAGCTAVEEGDGAGRDFLRAMVHSCESRTREHGRGRSRGGASVHGYRSDPR